MALEPMKPPPLLAFSFPTAALEEEGVVGRPRGMDAAAAASPLTTIDTRRERSKMRRVLWRSADDEEAPCLPCGDSRGFTSAAPLLLLEPIPAG